MVNKLKHIHGLPHRVCVPYRIPEGREDHKDLDVSRDLHEERKGSSWVLGWRQPEEVLGGGFDYLQAFTQVLDSLSSWGLRGSGGLKDSQLGEV